MLLVAAAFVGTAATVSLRTDVEPLHQIMPKLAAATGRRLSHAPSLKWQLNFIRVSDADPNLLLAHVAQANYGRWEQQADGSQVLTFDEARASRDLAKRRSERAALIRKALDRKTPFTFADDQDPAMVSMIKGVQLAEKVAQGISPDLLASLDPGEVIVFSTRPTQAQRMFPNFKSDWEADFQKLENERRARMASMAAQPKSPELLKIEGMLDPAYWEARKLRAKGIFSTQILTEPFWKIDVTIEAEENRLNCEISAFDESGLEQLNEGVQIGIYPDSLSEADGNEPVERSKPLKVSAESEEVLASWSGETNERMPERLARIAEVDPILRTYSDLVEAYTRSEAQDYVLVVPHNPHASRSVSDYSVKSWLEGADFARLELKDGWTVSVPTKPIVALNREVFAKFVSHCHEPVPSFEDRAWMAARYGEFPQSERSIMDWALEVFDKSSMRLNGRLLRIYGYLSSADQRRLRDGHEVTVGSLPAPAKKIVAQLGQKGLSTLREPSANSDYVTMAQWNYGYVFDMLGYPTNALPNGVPAEAALSLKATKQKSYLPADSSMGTHMSQLGLDGMPDSILISTYVGIQFDPQIANKDPEVIESMLEELNLILIAAPGFGRRERYWVRQPSPADRKVRVSALGEEFQALLKPAMARAREYDAYRKARAAYSGGSASLLRVSELRS